MSRFARRGNHDANHAEVAGFYADLGCSVADTSAAGFGFPDLVIGCIGATALVEIKVDDGHLSTRQERFKSDWRGGPIQVIRSLADAEAHVKRVRAVMRFTQSFLQERL